MSQADRTLDSMFPATSSSKHNTAELSSKEGPEVIVVEDAPPPQSPVKIQDIEESECYLTSVKKMRNLVSKHKHNRTFKIVNAAISADQRYDRPNGNHPEARLCGHCRPPSIFVSPSARKELLPCKPLQSRVRVIFSNASTLLMCNEERSCSFN